MTEEMKYYTGNCITDLHTDTSISSNEEKCKQYIKSDGLNFCMSSVCPEKDCIYALVNKLHQKIDCLEQENKELKEENIKVKKEFNNLIAEIISDIEYTGEIACNGESPKEHLHQMQKALASLEEIKNIVENLSHCKIPHEHCFQEDCSDCILNEIKKEVLK